MQATTKHFNKHSSTLLSCFHFAKSLNTLSPYKPTNKLTLGIESLVSSRDPLWLELLGCSLSAIDGAGDSLSSRSSSIGCRFNSVSMILSCSLRLCSANLLGCLFLLYTIPPSSLVLSVSSVSNAETQSSLSLLPLLPWIYCGIYILLCFLHVCVPIPLWFLFHLSTLSASLSFTLKKTLPQPSLPFIVQVLRV
jgi:hypothetical protein